VAVSSHVVAAVSIDSLDAWALSVYNDRGNRGYGGVHRDTMLTSHDDAVAQPPEPRSEPTGEPVVARTRGEPPDLLRLLNDEYARRILRVLSEGSYRGRELSERCEFSRPTVYRRLNRLENAEVVRSELRIDPDGNHCKEFFLVRDYLEVTLESGTITVTARQSNHS